MITDLKPFFTLLTVMMMMLGTHAEIVRDKQGRPVPYAPGVRRYINLLDHAPRPGEFRGVWIATVNNMDFPASYSVEQFKRTYRTMIANIARSGGTAVFFQLRANCDAFYPSRHAPYSRWYTGVEGRGLRNFDPLSFMVTEAHRAGLAFHAWLNPYRVASNSTRNEALRRLHPANFARRYPQYVIEANKQVFLDPGIPAVRRHVVMVVQEIISRYNVDAVVFDDYFYPYEGTGNADAASFRTYNHGRLKLADWRRRNTETLMVEVRRMMNLFNRTNSRKVQFGISPFGIWANKQSNKLGSLTGGKESYSAIFADTRKWVKNGYVDYIVPQIYWHFGHEVAAYAALTDWWCQTVKGTNTRLYIGMGAYNGGKWQHNELIDQMRYNRMKPEVSGAAFFSYRSFFGKERNSGAINLLRYIKKYR